MLDDETSTPAESTAAEPAPAPEANPAANPAPAGGGPTVTPVEGP